MQIVSSVIAWNLPQSDGSIVVRELHTDNTNLQYTYDYNTSANADLNANIAAHVAALNIMLTQKAAYLAANPGVSNGVS